MLNPRNRARLAPIARAARLATGLSLLALTSGCGDLELPPAPDMSELVQAYSEPDGDLDPSLAVDFGKALIETLRRNRESSPIEIANEVVQNLQDLGGGAAKDTPANDGAGVQEVNGSRIDLAAIARVHHICRGFANDPLNEAENGSLDLTVTLDQRGLIPTIWGTTNRCRFVRQEVKVEMDGDLRVNFGDGAARVGLRYLANLAYLFQFEGTLGLTRGDEHSDLDLNSHFKVSKERGVLFLITLSDGNRVVGTMSPADLSPSGGPTLTMGVVGRNGRWECSVDLASGHGSCTSSENSVVEW